MFWCPDSKYSRVQELCLHSTLIFRSRLLGTLLKSIHLKFNLANNALFPSLLSEILASLILNSIKEDRVEVCQ